MYISKSNFVTQPANLPAVTQPANLPASQPSQPASQPSRQPCPPALLVLLPACLPTGGGSGFLLCVWTFLRGVRADSGPED